MVNNKKIKLISAYIIMPNLIMIFYISKNHKTKGSTESFIHYEFSFKLLIFSENPRPAPISGG